MATRSYSEQIDEYLADTPEPVKAIDDSHDARSRQIDAYLSGEELEADPVIEPEAPVEEPLPDKPGFMGGVSDAYTATKAGAISGVGMAAKAINVGSTNETIDKLSQKVVDWSDKKQVEPDLRQSEQSKTGVRKAVWEGFKSNAESTVISGPAKVAAFVGGAAAGQVAIPVPIIGAISGGIAAASMVGGGVTGAVFSMSSYYDEKKAWEARNPGKKLEDDPVAFKAALISAGAEGGGEGLADVLSTAIGGKAGATALEFVGKGMGKTFAKESVKQFGKTVVKELPFEVGSEVFTGAVQQSQNKALGKDLPHQSLLEILADVGPSTAIATVLGGGQTQVMSSALHYNQAKNTRTGLIAEARFVGADGAHDDMSISQLKRAILLKQAETSELTMSMTPDEINALSDKELTKAIDFAGKEFYKEKLAALGLTHEEVTNAASKKLRELGTKPQAELTNEELGLFVSLSKVRGLKTPDGNVIASHDILHVPGFLEDVAKQKGVADKVVPAIIVGGPIMTPERIAQQAMYDEMTPLAPPEASIDRLQSAADMENDLAIATQQDMVDQGESGQAAELGIPPVAPDEWVGPSQTVREEVVPSGQEEAEVLSEKEAALIAPPFIKPKAEVPTSSGRKGYFFDKTATDEDIELHSLKNDGGFVPKAGRKSSFNMDKALAKVGLTRDTVDLIETDSTEGDELYGTLSTGEKVLGRGRFSQKTGKLHINYAAIKDQAELETVIRHEVVHARLTSEKGRAEITKAIRGRLTSQVIRNIEGRMTARGENETREKYLDRVVNEYAGHLAEEKPALWKEVVQVVKEYLAKAGIRDLTDKEVGQAIIRAVRSESAKPSESAKGEALNSLITPDAVGYSKQKSPEYTEPATGIKFKELSDRGLRIGGKYSPNISVTANGKTTKGGVPSALAREHKVIVVTGKAGDIFAHAKLFKASPHLADIDVTMDLNPAYRDAKGSHFNTKTGAIKLQGPNIDSALTTFIHETTHATARKSGLPQGSSPDTMGREMTKIADKRGHESIVKPAHQKRVALQLPGMSVEETENLAAANHRRVTGEVYATATMWRRFKTQAELNASPFFAYIDEHITPRSMQIDLRELPVAPTPEQVVAKQYGKDILGPFFHSIANLTSHMSNRAKEEYSNAWKAGVETKAGQKAMRWADDILHATKQATMLDDMPIEEDDPQDLWSLTDIRILANTLPDKSLATFAQNLGQYVKPEDVTLEDARRTAQDIITDMHTNITNYVLMIDPAKAKAYFLKMVADKDFNDPVVLLEATEMEMQINAAIKRGFLDDLVKKETDRMNKERRDAFYNILDYFDGNPDYEPEEKALIAYMAARFNVGWSEKEHDMVPRKIEANNFHPVMALDGGTNTIMRDELRKGTTAKTAIVEAVRQRHLLDKKAAETEDKDTGWRIFKKSDKDEDALAFNRAVVTAPIWCIAGGVNMAKSYLSRGDVHVYYEKGKAIIGISTENGNITQGGPKGVEPGQALSDHAAEIAEKYLIENKHGLTGGQAFLDDRNLKREMIALLKSEKDENGKWKPENVSEAIKRRATYDNGILITDDELSVNTEITVQPTNFRFNSPSFSYHSPTTKIIIDAVLAGMPGKTTRLDIKNGVLNTGQKFTFLGTKIPPGIHFKAISDGHITNIEMPNISILPYGTKFTAYNITLGVTRVIDLDVNIPKFGTLMLPNVTEIPDNAKMPGTDGPVRSGTFHYPNLVKIGNNVHFNGRHFHAKALKSIGTGSIIDADTAELGIRILPNGVRLVADSLNLPNLREIAPGADFKSFTRLSAPRLEIIPKDIFKTSRSDRYFSIVLGIKAFPPGMKELNYKGSLVLNKLKEIPPGMTISMTGSISMLKLEKIGAGATLNIGYAPVLKNLKTIEEGSSINVEHHDLMLPNLVNVGKKVWLASTRNIALHNLEYLPQLMKIDAGRAVSTPSLLRFHPDARIAAKKLGTGMSTEVGKSRAIGSKEERVNLAKRQSNLIYANGWLPSGQNLYTISSLNGRSYSYASPGRWRVSYAGHMAERNTTGDRKGELVYPEAARMIFDPEQQRLSEEMVNPPPEIPENVLYADEGTSVNDITAPVSTVSELSPETLAIINEAHQQLYTVDPTGDVASVIARHEDILAAQQEEDSRPVMLTGMAGIDTINAALEFIVKNNGVAIEYNIKAVEGMNLNRSKKVQPEDMHDHDFTVHNGKTDLMHFSPSCPNYSPIKLNAKESEEDLKLARTIARAIGEVNSPIVTIENVARYKNSKSYKIIMDALNRNGYMVDAHIYQAADFGSPSYRNRLFIRAVKGQLLTLPPVATHQGRNPDGTLRHVGWFDTIKDIIDSGELETTTLDPKIIKSLELEGIFINNIKEPLMISTFGFRNHLIDGSYEERVPQIMHKWGNDAAPVIIASKGSHYRIILPNGLIFKTTPRINARLMGLPDTFKLHKTAGHAYRGVGNGIPTQLTKAIIEPLVQQLRSHRLVYENYQLPYLLPDFYKSYPGSYLTDTIVPHPDIVKPEEMKQKSKEKTEARKADARQPELWSLTAFEPTPGEQLWALSPFKKTGNESYFRSKLSVDQEMMVDSIVNMYAGDSISLGPITIKELMQNAFDAIKHNIREGILPGGMIRMEIAHDPDNVGQGMRVFRITDNGRGMPKSMLEPGGAFLTIGKTGKTSEKDSGSYGVAKAVFLTMAEWITVETNHNGTKTVMQATGRDIAGTVAGIDMPDDAFFTTPTTDPNGTTVTIKIPIEYVNRQTGAVIEIPELDFNVVEVKKSPLLHDNIQVEYYKDGVNVYGPDIGKDFPIDQFTVFRDITFPGWGTARILAGKDGSTRYGPNVHILSNGIYQFSMLIPKKPGEGQYNAQWTENIGREIYIDINPAPGINAKNPAYPIEMNRKGFKPEALAEVNHILNYLWVVYNRSELAKDVGTYGELQVVSTQGTIKKTHSLKPADKKATVSDVFDLDKNDQIELRNGEIFVNNRQVPVLSLDALKDLAKAGTKLQDFILDQSKVSPDDIVVRDNTFIVDKAATESEIKAAQVPDNGVLKLAREKFTPVRVNKLLNNIGRIFRDLRDAAERVTEDATVIGANDVDGYYGLKNLPVGINIEKSTNGGLLFGVFTQVPFKGVFINIGNTKIGGEVKIAQDGSETIRHPGMAADGFFNTMLHELVHYKAKGHDDDSGFPSELAKLEIMLDWSKDFNLTAYKTKARKLVEANQDILIYLHKELRNASTGILGEPFKGAKEVGNDISIADQNRLNAQGRNAQYSGLGKTNGNPENIGLNTRGQENVQGADNLGLWSLTGAPGQGLNWDVDDEQAFEKWSRLLHDKDRDTKLVVAAVEKWTGQSLKDDQNPYLLGQLYRARAAEAVKHFADKDVLPFIKKLAREKISQKEIAEYLWFMHASERNQHIARINDEFDHTFVDPTTGNPKDEKAKGGSGKSFKEIKDYFAGLNPAKKTRLANLAKDVYAWRDKLQADLVKNGLETQDVIDQWNRTYTNYVPLFRDEFSADVHLSSGSGVNIRGRFSQQSIGSEGEVFSPLAGMTMLMEKAIIRSEKARVAHAAYRLANQAPNEDFMIAVDPNKNASEQTHQLWLKISSLENKLNLGPPTKQLHDELKNVKEQYKALRKKEALNNPKIIKSLRWLGLSYQDAVNLYAEPMEHYVNQRSGRVELRVDHRLRERDNVLNVRVNGEDKMIIFNPKNDRAMKMVNALKNADIADIGPVLGFMGKGTRWIAMVNTQWNPIFGVRNVMRDFSTAMLNLTSTPLNGQQAKVTKYALDAFMHVLKEQRAERKGLTAPVHPDATRLAEFRKYGGPTAWRAMFENAREYETHLDDLFKEESGKSHVKTIGKLIGGVLADFNSTTETMFRFAAFKVAREGGMSPEKAALLAKDLTVNFDRKGTMSSQIGSLYAFFNASAQGSVRMAETMWDFKTNKPTSAGLKILAGGLLLGVAQTLMLRAAGIDDDDEPSQAEREKNLILPRPFSDGKWVKIPMPLGFNILPNVGRIISEATFGNPNDRASRALDLESALLDTFNPLGSEQSMMQKLSFTVTDPAVNLWGNSDWNGRQIYKENYNPRKPEPGFERVRDTATILARGISWALDKVSGGSEGVPGKFSYTPDAIDYLIGYGFGGMGREVIKAAQYVDSKRTGEVVPRYKIPLIGGFTFDEKDPGGQASIYYANTKKILEAQTIREYRRAQGKGLGDFFEKYPEARLYGRMQEVEKAVNELKQSRTKMKERKMSQELIQRKTDRINTLYINFNTRMKEIEKIYNEQRNKDVAF